MPASNPIRIALRWFLVVLYLVAGAAHLRSPATFLHITPAWVPDAPLVIAVTGACEIAGALALAQGFVPLLRRAAGVALAAYAICVVPANYHHMMLDMARPDHGWGMFYHLPRLALQPVLVWLALWASEVTDWPWRAARPD